MEEVVDESPSILVEARSPLLDSTPFLYRFSGTLSRATLASAAYEFAKQLPKQPHLLLMPQNKAYFWVGLLATALKQGKIILPPNTAPNSLNSLLSEIPEGQSCTLTDNGLSRDGNGVKKINWDTLWQAPEVTETETRHLQTCLDAVPIELYTSGSSGTPKSVCRTGQQMMCLARKGLEYFDWKPTDFIVGTVPPQHMFGLETTIFWPFVSGARVASHRPFFAEDIEESLTLGAGFRRWLVSTPTHLSHINKFQTHWSALPNAILSATSVMSFSLAKELKTHFHSEIYEVYGSTETGSFAYRQPLTAPYWNLYSDRHLTESGPPNQVNLRLEDLQETHPLQDSLKRVGPRQFQFLGRASDMVKVAGKRTSLSELNQHLLAIEGVEDGIFYQPYDNGRLTAFVVSSLSLEQIKFSLAQFVDPVFLPRPLIKVQELPRNELGKLSRKNLEAMVTRHAERFNDV